jgi:nucleoid DNA-binding protein
LEREGWFADPPGTRVFIPLQENFVVTKKEIVKTISEEIGLTQLKTKEIVQKTFDAIVETLVDDGRIELRNFGVFEVKKRAARKARNPRTGDKVFVPAKYVVTFKPGKEMEERVRLLEQREAAAEQAAAAAAESAAASGEMAPGESPPSAAPAPQPVNPPPTYGDNTGGPGY